ncbi:MAG: bifunctional DNA-formamidopyrimidine glycosylase/DNA-(apurinic or apyrimidinic site) lyase [Acidobacteria bacterium]|uniref:Formamidopyrimidine-DNA glycosylase n=1 Tax=Candidatus Polarisedimenticola svalbardensis TaxID=2886004 RepID=A0A8J6XT00_9BACT|nr:bifunctional DNA-formamidopyrimidine glycosylase/DNA-(apurinic or apyrimidinic site) lyase [Candidatus Polarisedimenticola svalbardensis]
MPELPEVETVARTLRPALEGAVLRSVSVLEPGIIRHGPKRLGTKLRGRELTAIRRHGKRLTFEFDPDLPMYVHLGMTGSLMLAEPGLSKEKHTHLVFRFEGDTPEMRFVDPRRFGGVWIGDPASGRFSADLGPDALEIGLREFRSIFSRNRQAKALLMDQGTLAGMGNIYCDEALFRAGIHPLSRGIDLEREQVARLHGAMKKILKDAIAHRGSTIRDYRDSSGSEGSFQSRHQVYGREGEPCQSCGTALLRIQVASRSTHLCPSCQPITNS